MARPDRPINGKFSACSIPIWPANWARTKEGLEYYSFNDLTNQIDIEDQAKNARSLSRARARTRTNCERVAKGRVHLYNSWSFITASRTAWSRRAPGISRRSWRLTRLQARAAPPWKNRSGQSSQPGGFGAHRRFFPALRGDCPNRLSPDHSPAAGPAAPGLVQIGTNLMEALRTGQLHPAEKD